MLSNDEEILLTPAEAVASLAIIAQCLEHRGGEYDKLQLSVLGKMLGLAHMTLTAMDIPSSKQEREDVGAECFVVP